MADFCPGLLWSFLWLLILWFIMWPIAGILAAFYLLFMPFAACIPALKEVNDTLLRWMQYCEKIGENIKNMTPVCS